MTKLMNKSFAFTDSTKKKHYEDLSQEKRKTITYKDFESS